MTLRAGWTLLLLATLGCEGLVVPAAGSSSTGTPSAPTTPTLPVDPVAPVPTPSACTATRVVPAQPLRRLSSEQYANVIEDLFGAQAAPLLQGSLFPPTVIKAGFTNDAEANTVNTAQSNAIEDNAERIAAAVLAAPQPFLRALLPCTLGATVTDAAIDGCIDGFITAFGQRAYRRPLTPAEAALARSVYAAVRPSQSATQAFAALVQFFVQAPALLYRVERGDGPAAEQPGLVRLTPYELAGRLSFLFQGSGPDAALLQAAAEGALATPAQVAAQARRLSSGARFQQVMHAFHRDWLRLDDLSRGKDATLFPGYTAALRASLAQEPDALLSAVLEQGDGRLATLLGTSRLPVDATLAAYYGAPAPASAWATVEVPNRRGLLTLASVQAALGGPTQSSPIHRGNFLRTNVLCGASLTLPANVDVNMPLGTAGAATARQRLEPLMTNTQCSGCHVQMNPLGYALENYDSAGAWRATENGATIDASGAVDLGAGPVPYAGPTELAALLAPSERVERCYSLQWFRAAQGRSETPADACSLETLQQQVRASGGDLRALLVALTQTDAFLYRQPVAP